MNKYVFKPYSPLFPELFAKEKERIASHLQHVFAIEHIGSTAILNLGGKGIIDIAIAVPKEEMSATVIKLQQLGYEFRPHWSTPERFYLIIYLPDPEEGTRRYHIHLTYPGSSNWEEMIGFRDYLRKHPEAASEYAEMKKKAVLESNQEGELYRKIKAPMFQKVQRWQNALSMSVEPLNASSLSEAIAFLQEHEDTALFLLGNLEQHGPTLNTFPNSGNFKLIRSDGKILAVFCLSRRGNLLVQASQSDPILMEKILLACQEESLPILGLLGEWDFCECLWRYFKEKKVILEDTWIGKEVLYSLDLSKRTVSREPHVRFLEPKNYEDWKVLCLEYLKESGIPNHLSDKQMHEEFLEKSKQRIIWGYFLKEQLIAIAELNARAFGLAWVGGVYTAPLFRKKGFAKSVLQQLIYDAKTEHHIRKLIISTEESNGPARKLYESLQVQIVGSYALMFGRKR